MKKIFKKISKQRILTIFMFLSIVLFTMCVKIDGVTQPETATVGEEINIMVNISLNPEVNATQSLIFGFLAPESWDVEGTANLTYTSNVGDGSMSIIDDSELAPDSGGLNWTDEITTVLGKGDNYGKVRWVVYKSDVPLTVLNGVTVSGNINLAVTTGPENLITQLGYVVGGSGQGVRGDDHDSLFTDCMEVTGGSNPTDNLCGSDPNLVVFSPESFTIEDVITMNFDSKKGDATLANASQVYLCVTGMVNGSLVEVCDNGSSLKMSNKGNGIWGITMWPRNLLNVPANATLTDFKYSFINEAGDIIVQDSNTMEGFILQENCN
jgi:hypothetical protein